MRVTELVSLMTRNVSIEAKTPRSAEAQKCTGCVAMIRIASLWRKWDSSVAHAPRSRKKQAAGAKKYCDSKMPSFKFLSSL